MIRLWLQCVVALCLMIASCGQAATLHQIDDFQSDMTNVGWEGFKPRLTGPPARAAGGPVGTDDYYLEQSTVGYHLATYNASQWSGDYLGAGIQAIEMDVNHLAGPDAIALRIAVTGPGGFFSSTDPTSIAGGQWQHYLFGLTDSDMIHVAGGTGNLADTLSAVDKLLIRHDIADPPTPPGRHPQHITATVGFDNIRAIPEPHPGDANLDTVTDLSDFNIWNAHKFTSGANWTTGDFNGDGSTDLSDFNIWNAAKFTSAGGGAAPAPTEVPEPSSFVLMILASVGFIGFAYRRRG